MKKPENKLFLNKWKRAVIVVLIILFVMPSLSPAMTIPARLNKTDKNTVTNSITYTITFSEEKDVVYDTFRGYDCILLKEGTFVNEVGKPMMPAKQIKIALPAGMAVTQVRVVDTQTVDIKGEYTILPAQHPLRVGQSDSDIDFVEPDFEIYASSQPYPSNVVEFVHQSDLAGQGLAVIMVYPLHYIPSEKKLTLYTSISFAVDGVDGYECGDYLSSEKYGNTYKSMIENVVINPDDVQLDTGPQGSPTSRLSGGPYEHVIISINNNCYWVNDSIR